MYTNALRALGLHNIRQCTKFVFYQFDGTSCILYSILKELYTLKTRQNLIRSIFHSLQRIHLGISGAVIKAFIVIVDTFPKRIKRLIKSSNEVSKRAVLYITNHIQTRP